MKHCFIINPAAGNGRVQEALLPGIIAAEKQRGTDYEIHRTSGPSEATLYTGAKLSDNPDEKIRFYSCGGDGTTAEILNGLYGHANAELGIIPAGSGNDFVRNFGANEKFRDIATQLGGKVFPIDVIKYTYKPKLLAGDEEEKEITHFAINMINMGFDAKAAYHMARLKNKFFLKGTGAYIAGVFRELTEYKMSRIIIRLDGEEPFETSILLAGVGNGQFSGGGFQGMPAAVVNDGLLDLMYIEPINRRQFLNKINVYHDGKHPEDSFLKDITLQYRITNAEIEPVGGLVFTADGEPHYTEETLKISVAPEKVMFVLPEGVTY